MAKVINVKVLRAETEENFGKYEIEFEGLGPLVFDFDEEDGHEITVNGCKGWICMSNFFRSEDGIEKSLLEDPNKFLSDPDFADCDYPFSGLTVEFDNVKDVFKFVDLNVLKLYYKPTTFADEEYQSAIVLNEDDAFETFTMH